MDVFFEAYDYAVAHLDELVGALRDHLVLVGIALAVGILICVPLGVWTSRSPAAEAIFVNLFNGLRVIPSLAILFLAIPYLGLSFTSSVLALTVLALPPILINTDAAFRKIDPAIREAAFGMGMAKGQVLRRVEFPLALPVIITGIRTATVEVIASATLAAFIGGGGLGTFVTRGFALYEIPILLVGAVPVALLALAAEVLLGRVQRMAEPPR